MGIVVFDGFLVWCCFACFVLVWLLWWLSGAFGVCCLGLAAVCFVWLVDALCLAGCLLFGWLICLYC